VQARYDKRFFIRLASILVVGVIAIVGVALRQRPKPPTPAPDGVQRQGLALMGDILAKIAPTGFGQSRRGQRLARVVRGLAARGRVVFSADIAPQALCRHEHGQGMLYIKVLRLGHKLVHQTPEEVAEGLFHEAVHMCEGHPAQSRIDEECDGYAAGLCAGAALVGRTQPDVLTIEGATVAEFVAREYPHLSRCPQYQPVGQSREWLARRTGLR